MNITWRMVGIHAPDSDYLSGLSAICAESSVVGATVLQ